MSKLSPIFDRVSGPKAYVNKPREALPLCRRPECSRRRNDKIAFLAPATTVIDTTHRPVAIGVAHI